MYVYLMKNKKIANEKKRQKCRRMPCLFWNWKVPVFNPTDASGQTLGPKLVTRVPVTFVLILKGTVFNIE